MQRRSGFTIVELLGALVLIAIAAAIAVPAYFGRSEITLERASILLARDLRSVQNRAAYLGETSTVSFLEEGDGYRVTDPTGVIIRNPSTDLPFERRYSADGVFQGVSILDVRFGPDHAVTYDERGVPQEEGELTLSFRGDTRTLRLHGITGVVEILGTTSGWVDSGY